jgi:hypothetical protein
MEIPVQDHDPQYEHDITVAGRIAEGMRHQGQLGRVLWLLNEKVSWDLEINAEILTRVKAIEESVDGGLPIDPLVVDLIKQMLAFLVGVVPETPPGEAASLNLTLGLPEPNA